jgi:hypothetical protein
MVGEEEYIEQKFEKFKKTLPIEEFKEHIEDHVEHYLELKEFIVTFPFIDEEDDEEDRIRLHGIKRLVAGLVQEWELVHQPEHAAACAKLDGSLVWQGRGYVSPITHAVSSLKPSLQG